MDLQAHGDASNLPSESLPSKTPMAVLRELDRSGQQVVKAIAAIGRRAHFGNFGARDHTTRSTRRRFPVRPFRECRFIV